MSNAHSKEPAVEHRYADLGDVKLHYVEAGSGPLVVLLHGFPEFWYSWRFQIPALTEAGFRVVAPDMRGYNLSDRPQGVENYRVEALARDVARLIRALGEERAAAVVGHDWGGAVAWTAAMRHPEMMEKLVILNCPHPDRFLRGLWTPKQLRRSWYVFALQTPGPLGRLAQRIVFDWLKSNFRKDPVRPEAFSEEDIQRYEEAMSRPGALTATTNYYRALVRGTPAQTRKLLRIVEAPVLVIWGEKDRYLGPELAEPDRSWAPNARVDRLPDASHWVQVDRPEKVNELLLGFLLRVPGEEPAGENRSRRTEITSRAVEAERPTRYKEANPFYRFMRWQAATAPMSWLFARTLHHLDRPVFRLTKGKQTFASLVSGLPVVMLATTGARSGQRRTVPLLGFPDGERIVVVASNYGQRRHPAWYHNLRTYPEAEISVGGQERRVLAREAEGAERERLWQLGLTVYPGWTCYERRAANRRIPVMILSPRE